MISISRLSSTYDRSISPSTYRVSTSNGTALDNARYNKLCVPGDDSINSDALKRRHLQRPPCENRKDNTLSTADCEIFTKALTSVQQWDPLLYKSKNGTAERKGLIPEMEQFATSGKEYFRRRSSGNGRQNKLFYDVQQPRNCHHSSRRGKLADRARVSWHHAVSDARDWSIEQADDEKTANQVQNCCLARHLLVKSCGYTPPCGHTPNRKTPGKTTGRWGIFVRVLTPGSGVPAVDVRVLYRLPVNYDAVPHRHGKSLCNQAVVVSARFLTFHPRMISGSIRVHAANYLQSRRKIPAASLAGRCVGCRVWTLPSQRLLQGTYHPGVVIASRQTLLLGPDPFRRQSAGRDTDSVNGQTAAHIGADIDGETSIIAPTSQSAWDADVIRAATGPTSRHASVPLWADLRRRVAYRGSDVSGGHSHRCTSPNAFLIRLLYVSAQPPVLGSLWTEAIYNSWQNVKLPRTGLEIEAIPPNAELAAL
ncbi:hypothetical protein Bbelb_324040 [Branchiostoma belcheri]|nr:hypothetical protein Bbelb_324040 [Branchiostoma belcheri]